MKSLNKNGLFCCFLIFFSSFIYSCSEDSNFNKLFVSSADKKSFNYLYSQATAAYDANDMDTALSFADSAYDINPNHTGLNILYGNIYLAKSGMDVIHIVQKYLDREKDENTSKLASFLSMFGTILVEQDVLKLGELSVSETELFKNYPLIHPKTFTEVRSLGISALDSLTQLKRHICRYIDPSLNNTSCASNIDNSSLTVKQSRQTKLLWAFSHLVEAITLAQAIVYTPPAQSEGSDSSKTSLESRAEALKGLSADRESLIANMDEYLTAISELSADVDSVFNIKDSDSLFVTLINDLKTTSSSLLATIDKNKESDKNYLKKLSDKIESVITVSEEQRNSVDESIVNGKEDTSEAKDVLALKGKLMNKANDSLTKQIEKLQPGDITDDQKSSLCEKYSKITNSKELPTICQ